MRHGPTETSSWLNAKCQMLSAQMLDSSISIEEQASMEFRRVGFVGAGRMGNGIAPVFARHRYEVVLCDVEQRFLDRGLAIIGKNLDREVSKNILSATDKAA